MYKMKWVRDSRNGMEVQEVGDVWIGTSQEQRDCGHDAVFTVCSQTFPLF